MPISADEFRAGMSLRAGGVAIVTARSGETVHGMTVTDYAGVSMSPPLAMVCADKSSNTLSVIREGRCFALSLLSVAQVELSNRFASKEREWQRFDGLDCGVGRTGAPLIPGAVASFDCALEAEHDAGDHVIFVGCIEHLVQRDLEPLIYVSGRYGRLAALER